MQRDGEDGREPEVCYVWLVAHTFTNTEEAQEYIDSWPNYALSPNFWMSLTLEKPPKQVAEYSRARAYRPWLVIDKKAMWPVAQPEEEDLEAES